MNLKPLIMTLDLATRTGFCIGRAGAKPRFGVWRLKTPEDGPRRAGRNLGCRLRDEFAFERPDLVVVEAAMNPAAMHAAGNSHRTVTLLTRLQGAVDAACGMYGIRQKDANVQSVRAAVLGHGRPPDPKGTVVAYVNSIGFNTKDDNEADAIMMWLDEMGFRNGLDLEGVLP